MVYLSLPVSMALKMQRKNTVYLLTFDTGKGGTTLIYWLFCLNSYLPLSWFHYKFHNSYMFIVWGENYFTGSWIQNISFCIDRNANIRILRRVVFNCNLPDRRKCLDDPGHRIIFNIYTPYHTKRGNEICI